MPIMPKNPHIKYGRNMTEDKRVIEMHHSGCHGNLVSIDLFLMSSCIATR